MTASVRLPFRKTTGRKHPETEVDQVPDRGSRGGVRPAPSMPGRYRVKEIDGSQVDRLGTSINKNVEARIRKKNGRFSLNILS